MERVEIDCQRIIERVGRQIGYQKILNAIVKEIGINKYARVLANDYKQQSRVRIDTRC